MSARRILFGNISISGRSGTEMFLYDLVRGVQKRGYLVSVFSPRRGLMAMEFEKAGVPVVTNMDDVAWTPDLLHCQHTLPTLEMVGRFPQIPAVYVCHDGKDWSDSAPPLPSVVRFAAVDLFCRDRVAFDTGRPAADVQVIPNSVDFAQFKPRESPLPPHPTRAMLFTSHSERHEYLDTIRSACSSLRLPLDEFGPAVGRTIDQPERILPNYDLVFAKARCALEAMSAGCAVVLAGPEGAGPIVTPTDFDLFRQFNFGRSLLNSSGATEMLVRQIRQYDPQAAQQVQARVRGECGLDKMVDAYVDLYEEVLATEYSFDCNELVDYLGRIAARLESHLQQLHLVLEEREESMRNAHATAETASSWYRLWQRICRIAGFEFTTRAAVGEITK